MKRSAYLARRQSAGNRRAFALVLTLLSLVLLTVLVVGFNAATRTEQMAARNFSYQGVAAQMADVAVNRAVALLNTTATNGVVTQPGRAWNPGTGFVQLSSAAVGAGGSNINLNVQQQDGSETNYFIATNTNSAFFTVPLIDVRVGNTLVGRYGFWIDDDGSRMNLNAAWTNARSDFLPTNARPYSLSVFTNLPSFGATRFGAFGGLITDAANSSTVGWGYFFTPRQLVMLTNLDMGTYRKIMFQTSGGPGNQARSTFALAPGGQPAALDAGGADGFLSVYGNAAYTQSYGDLVSALDGVVGNYLSGPRFSNYFGTTGGMVSKYGADIARQIVANINDASLLSAADAFTGANASDMLAGPDTTGPNNPVPRVVLGLRPSPYLNEIAVAVAQSTNGPASGAELQIWMQCELVDPYRTGEGAGYEIKYKIGTLRFTGTYVAGGTTNSFANPGSSVNWNWDGGSKSVINAQAIPKDSYLVPPQAFLFEWQAGGLIPATASNIVFTSVEVEPVVTLLRRTPGVAASVRDWAAGDDFPTGHFVFNNVPVNDTAYGFNGYGAFEPPAAVQFQRAIAKNDPRVRRFADYSPPMPAWTPVAAATLGAANTTFNPTNGTGVVGVANDLAAGATSIFNHPSFPTNATASDRIIPQWVSALELGKIHTGLQWRTLQLRAQDLAERNAGHVPDWVVLESFAVSNNAVKVPAKLNVNSLAYPAASTPGMNNPTNLLNAGMARPLVVASLLAGNTNASSAANAQINGVNLGIPTNAALKVSGSDSFLSVATNVTTLAFAPTWGGNRPTNLPTNALGMLAEVLEIDGVSNLGSNEGDREGRVRGFYDALTASSDVFTVYSVGYAMDKNTNVTGENFLRTQVARDPANPNKFRVIFSEPLIWK